MIPAKQHSTRRPSASKSPSGSPSPVTLRVAAWSADALVRFGTAGKVLIFGLLIVALSVWAIRVPALKSALWPWLALLAGMFIAADALVALAPPAPNRQILPTSTRGSGRVVFNRGIASLFIGAAILTMWIVLLLWPNYQNWSGTFLPWLLAVVLVILGSWLIGNVSGGSPRLAPRSTGWPKGTPGRALEILLVLAIFAIAVFLRTYRLDTIPPGIANDETDAGMAAVNILGGQSVSPFSTSWYDTPSAFIYYLALIYRLAGATWTGLKLASLIPGLLTLAAIYLLGRELFGAMTGLCAMALLSISRWHITMSRWAWNALAVPLLLALSLYFLLRALRLRRALDYSLSGLLAGLMAYTYISSRLAALILCLYIVYWIISEPAGVLIGLRRRWHGYVILAFTFLVMIAPLAVTYIKSPEIWSHRTAEVTILNDIRAQGTLRPLLLNVADMLKSLHQRGDPNGLNNLPGEPMLDPFSGALCAVGLAYSILRWRDHRNALLLLWLAVGLAGAVLTLHSQSPQAYRSFLALPAIALLSAIALVETAHAVRAGVQAIRPRRARTWAAFASTGFAVLLLSAAGTWDAARYFGAQAHSKDVFYSFAPDRTAVARETVKRLAAGDSVYLWGGYKDQTQLRFLVYGLSQSLSAPGWLAHPPYRFVEPAWDLPLIPDGNGATILYEPSNTIADYLRYLYPDAEIEVVMTPFGSPLFMRASIPADQVNALSGLVEKATFNDGATTSSVASHVEAAAQRDVRQLTWDGILRIPTDGEYSLIPMGGLRLSVEDRPWEGKRFLSHGSYLLHLEWSPENGSGAPALLWQTPDQATRRIPEQYLMHLPEPLRGLRAEYYPNADWSGPTLFSGRTALVQLSWPDAPAGSQDGVFSVRLSGLLRIPESGDYTFRALADDGVRLFLDDRLLGEGLVPHQANSFEASVDLKSGDHPIQLDYVQYGGASQLQLLWRHADGPFEPVPPSALVPQPP